MSTTPSWLRVVAYRLGQVRQQLGFVPPLSPEDKQEVQRWLPASALPLFYTMSNADQQHSLRVCRGLQAQGCSEHDMLAAALLHDVGKAQGRVPFWTRPVIVLGKRLAPNLLQRVIFPLEGVRVVGTDSSRPSGLSTLEWRHPGRPQERIGKLHGRPQGATLLYAFFLHAVHVVYSRVTPCGRPRPSQTSQMSLSPQPSQMSQLPLQSYWTWRRALSNAWWHAEIGAELAEGAGLSQRAVLYIRTHHEPHGPAAALHRVDEVS